MIRQTLSRRAFVVAASAFGAGLVGSALADTPDTPDIPEPANEELTLFNEWLAEDIAGGGVIDNAQTTLQVAEDGAVSGRGGCNRYSGTAEISGETLSFGPVASTRMACAEALMSQEQSFFDALGRVQSFRIEQAERKLLLLDAGGQTIIRLTSMT